jgi:glyoxylase-like metal-dependent hydrolase (beta-lactamase superfamily II)
MLLRPFLRRAAVAASLFAVAALVGSAAFAADAPTHRFQQLAPGVHFATGTGPVFTLSNALVIEDDAGVTVVDSHVTPAATRALIASMKTITAKPITTVINTHYHFDHAHGNLAFPAGVTIIGHEFTRAKLAGDPMNERTYRFFSKLFADNAAAMKKQVAETKDPAAKAALEVQATAMANFVRDDKETRPVPPTVTLNDRMTLFRGTREIQILFLGRGHTGGDVVVFLPRERIVFTGDLLLQGPSYMGDAYLDEWIETIDKLKALDFEVVVPGHGEPFKDRASIDAFQAYMRDTWKQALEMRSKGIPALEAALRIDLTNHQKAMGQYASPLLPSGILSPGIEPNSILRIYELLDEREKSGQGLNVGGSRRSQ